MWETWIFCQNPSAFCRYKKNLEVTQSSFRLYNLWNAFTSHITLQLLLARTALLYRLFRTLLCEHWSIPPALISSLHLVYILMKSIIMLATYRSTTFGATITCKIFETRRNSNFSPPKHGMRLFSIEIQYQCGTVLLNNSAFWM